MAALNRYSSRAAAKIGCIRRQREDYGCGIGLPATLNSPGPLPMPTDMTKICVVGSANVDLIFRTQRLPQPGETFSGQSFQLCFGGKGANQAVTAARMGANVA